MRAGERAGPRAGFVYFALLAILAVLAIGLAGLATRWSDRVQREREQQLLRVGRLYAEAIAAYHHGSPGSDKTWPREIDDLLLDPRMLGTVRHLRAAYTDPMVPGRPFGLLRAADGTIRGVRSTSTARPFTQTAVDLGVTTLAPAPRYADWQFVPKEDS
jgi:type II secretory pathway pseudopilin PulG